MRCDGQQDKHKDWVATCESSRATGTSAHGVQRRAEVRANATNIPSLAPMKPMAWRGYVAANVSFVDRSCNDIPVDCACCYVIDRPDDHQITGDNTGRQNLALVTEPSHGVGNVASHHPLNER